HVRRARGGAVPALIARRGDADFARREFVSKTEETSVRTGVSAKAFLPQKITGDKTANKKERNGDCDRRKRLPEICGHQMIREFWKDGFVSGIPKQSIGYGPDKHVQRGAQRHIDQQPRPKKLRMSTLFLKQPAAEILQRKYVATPATNKPSKDKGRQDCQAKEDEAGIYKAILQGVQDR